MLFMQDMDLEGKKVLIREDLNVPVRNGRVVNDARLRAVLPTLEMAFKKGARVILMSHLGRPREGLDISQQQEFSLEPVAEKLSDLCGRKITLADPDFSSEQAEALKPGDCVLLENVRCNQGEADDEDEVARYYASLCDVFVMDAFGTAHRAQASTHGVAKFAPLACAGPLLRGELDALNKALKDPARPMLALVGGAKVSSKLDVLEALAQKTDHLIVGGGIANTFLAATGLNVGKSLHEKDMLDKARKIMEKVDIPLPTDVVVALELSESATATVKPVQLVEENEMILDIGPETIERFTAVIGRMSTILWNGPVGVFEIDAFAKGTEAVARAIAANGGFSIAGGGETVTAIEKYGISGDISYISTGGGAFLEFVEGKTLPAVAILEEQGD